MHTIIFAVDTFLYKIFHAREYPPPIKEPLPADSSLQFPDDEPPPPYTEQDNMEFQCHL